MKVYWTETATNHLLSIYEHIAQNAPMYAQQTVDKLIKRSEQIIMFPQSGRTVAEYEDEKIREIIESPYRLIYRIEEDRIDVLAVVHSAQRLLKE